jgi:hypothetical protein
MGLTMTNMNEHFQDLALQRSLEEMRTAYLSATDEATRERVRVDYFSTIKSFVSRVLQLEAKAKLLDPEKQPPTGTVVSGGQARSHVRPAKGTGAADSEHA